VARRTGISGKGAVVVTYGALIGSGRDGVNDTGRDACADHRRF